jgi:hypothetical protein
VGDVVAPALAPAAVIKTPGIDDVLERIEQEEDLARDRREWHEGVELKPGELAYFQTIFTAVLREANKRLLSHGVVLLACAPNPRGFGAVFMGTDREGREYDVTLKLPPEVRLAKEALGGEAFVRDLIGMVTEGVLEKRREYLARGGMQR